MSAFYVGKDSLSMLTDIIERYLVAGSDSFGFDFPKEIKEVFNGASRDSIFSALSADNVLALEERYGIRTAIDMYDGEDYEDGHDIWKPMEKGVQPWHYQLLKSCQCYVYQCTQGKVCESPIYIAMSKLTANIAMYIACSQPEYAKAEWI